MAAVTWCTRRGPPAYLPGHLPARLPTYLPTCPPTHLPGHLPAYARAPVSYLPKDGTLSYIIIDCNFIWFDTK